MRRIGWVATFWIAACSTAPRPEPELPVRGDTPGHTCRDDALGRFVGQLANVEIAADILRTSGAWTLRWAGPGMGVTRDYRTDRVTVYLDDSLSRIVRVSCG